MSEFRILSSLQHHITGSSHGTTTFEHALLPDKDRKCFYAVDGYIEELSLADLEELAKLESQSAMESKFGSVGWKFKKQLGSEWCSGVVVEIVEDAENGKDRRCHYPADDFYEDLSMDELKKLAKMDKNNGKMVHQVKHNDLCETCGGVGELLCCSTCNLVFHLGCTRPKLTELPEGDWSCAFCISSGDVVKKTSKQEQQKAHLAVKEIESLKEEARRKREESRRKSPRKRKSSIEN
mmetsp:Transcript_25048/g.52988  ORF Transcript_25048/g.52988 Transcript_25048/m.52988 type:complete len:237 (+) Transcript_25048:705-1415(+)